MAFSTIHVLNSKFATTDVAAAFWLTLAMAMLLRIARYARIRDYAGAGFFAGLATATKYPAGAIVFGLAAAHLGACRRAGRSFSCSFSDPRIYLAAGVAALVFFCATPYVLLDWRQTLGDYAFQKDFVMAGYSAAGYGWRWLFLRAMPDCFGLAMEALMLAGLAWGVFSRKPGTFCLLAFIGATFFALITSYQLFYRYILMPFPAMVLLAGGLVAALIGLARDRLGPRAGLALGLVAFGLLLAPSLVRDIQLDWVLHRTDTRVLALRWVEAHVPRGSTIAEIDNTTTYGKPPLWNKYQIVPFEDPASLRAKGIFWVLSDSYPALFYSRGPFYFESAELNSKATLVFDCNPLIEGAPAPIFDPNDAFYVPLRRISSVARPGPRIRIWKLK